MNICLDCKKYHTCEKAKNPENYLGSLKNCECDGYEFYIDFDVEQNKKVENKNIVSTIFEALNVTPGEYFKVNELSYIYKITKDLKIYYFDEFEGDWINSDYVTLQDFLTGKRQIVKME